jgi:hypothetical protein
MLRLTPRTREMKGVYMEEITVEATGEGGTPHDACAWALLDAIESLREFKPNDRSEIDRRYAVTITMMEQAYAYFATWVLGDLGK